MHHITFRAAIMAAALLLLPAPPAGAQDVKMSGAVHALWSAIDANFNARDATAFSQRFAEDVSFVRVKRGDALEGRGAVFEEFSRRFPNFAPGIRHHTTIHTVRPVAPGVLAADGTVEIERVGADAQPTLLSTYAIFTIMDRASGDWRVAILRIYELPVENGQVDSR